MELSDIYDRNAGYWDSKLYRMAYAGAYTRLLRSLAHDQCIKGPIRVLDCGVGAGLFSEALLNAITSPVELNGVDISEQLLSMAKSKFRGRGVLARLAFADICHLPYRDEDMDLVLSALVLEHVADPMHAVRELARVLRHGRPLVIVATRRGAPDHYFRRKYRYEPYANSEILGWLRQAGLEQISCRPLSGIARFFARAYVGVRV
jgi:demethylmenaquinone methyltransferase/2-methoxy-6-polyprenyl-1,4-benzoquinol methylase